MSHPHAAEVTADQADDWPPHAPETFHDLDRIGKAAAVLLGLATLTHLLSTWSDWHTYGVVNKYLGGVPNVEDADLNKADAIARLTSIPNVVISVAAAVVFVLWLWRARLNSEVFCQADHRHSHGWVLTSWFCPGANLFYPRQIVTDVWAASHPDTPVWTDDLRRYRRAPIIGAWWACWLGAMILDVAVRRVLMWVDPTVPVLRMIAISATVSVVLTASSAGLAAVIIRRVTWMQTSRPWIPWWDHREESRGSSKPATSAAESFPYAEAQRGERAYAESPYAELRPGFDQPLTEPLVAVAPAYQASREPQLVNTARLDLGAQPMVENRWSEQQPSDWSQPQPVAWSEAPNRSEPLGPVWSETRPMGLAPSTPPAPSDARPMGLPPTESRSMGLMPGAGPMSAPVAGPPAGSDPFDRPWLRQAESRPEPAPAPVQESPAEDEFQAWSPFAALVESWREQAEAEEAAESRWSAGPQAPAEAPGYLQSPGYLEPPSSYLEPSGSVPQAPEPIERPAAHRDPLHDPIRPSWQPEPQPEPRWSESRWSEPEPHQTEPEPRWSEPEHEPHWSDVQWNETPWSEPLRPEPEPPATQRSEPDWSEQQSYAEAQYSEPHWSERPAWNAEPQPPVQPAQPQPPAQQPQWSARPAPSAQAGWSAEPPASPPRLSVVPPLPAPEPGVGPAPVADPSTYAAAPSPDLLSPSAPIPAPAGPVPAGPAPRHLAKPQDPETAQPPAAASYLSQAPVVPGPPPAVQALLDQTTTPPRRPVTDTPPASQPVPRAQPANGPTAVPPASQTPRTERPGGQPPRAEQPAGQPSRDAAPRTYPRRRWTAG